LKSEHVFSSCCEANAARLQTKVPCADEERYARYAKHGHATRGVGAEPQDGVRWTSPEDGRTAEATEDPAQGRNGPRPKIILTLT